MITIERAFSELDAAQHAAIAKAIFDTLNAGFNVQFSDDDWDGRLHVVVSEYGRPNVMRRAVFFRDRLANIPVQLPLLVKELKERRAQVTNPAKPCQWVTSCTERGDVLKVACVKSRITHTYPPQKVAPTTCPQCGGPIEEHVPE